MKRFRKALAVWLSVLMVLSLFTATLTVSAVEDETVIIALSDYQPKDNLGVNRLNSIVYALKMDGIAKADRLFMAGDYNSTGSYGEPSSIPLSENGIATVKNAFGSVVDEKDILFIQGNHDLAAVQGLAKEGNHDPAYGDYGVYVIEEDNYAEWGSYNAASVEALKKYLDEKVESGWNKPIFILNHIPLHWSNRTLKDGSGTNGYKFFNVINEAGAKGLNIFYLFGHNHSSGYDDFIGGSCIFLKKGDPIEVCQGSKYNGKTETLNFTYMNAGYVGYYSTGIDTAEGTLTASVFRIRNNEVYVSRYSADGQYLLKGAGVENGKFTYDTKPAVNPTVYSGTFKIAADATATQVDTIYEMRDAFDVISQPMTSTSPEVKGVGFKFSMATDNAAIDEQCRVDLSKAKVKPYGDFSQFKLLRMGAVVTNDAAVGTDGGTFRLTRVDAKQVIDIPAVYAIASTEGSLDFAVRVICVPDGQRDTAIYARPYFVFENNGKEITVYGDITATTYNGKLSNNDGELDW